MQAPQANSFLSAAAGVNCFIHGTCILKCKIQVESNSNYCITLLYYIQVYQRLQKSWLCLSHYQTLKVIDDMYEDFDAKVMMWKGGNGD